MFLTFSEKDHISQTDIRGALRKRGFADQCGPELRKLPLVTVRIQTKQQIAADQLQHGVPQKLQPFVRRTNRTLFGVLEGVGAVGQCHGQQGSVLKAVCDLFFKVFQIHLS